MIDKMFPDEVIEEIKTCRIGPASNFYIFNNTLRAIQEIEATHSNIGITELEELIAQDFLNKSGVNASVKFEDIEIVSGDPLKIKFNSISITTHVLAVVESLTVNFEIS